MARSAPYHPAQSRLPYATQCELARQVRSLTESDLLSAEQACRVVGWSEGLSDSEIALLLAAAERRV